MKKAFTLVELLIVVIIIGILATIAVPQYHKMIEKARSAEACNMLGAIWRAEQLHYLEAEDYCEDVHNLGYLEIGLQTGGHTRTDNFIYGFTKNSLGGRDITIAAWSLVGDKNTITVNSYESPQYHMHETGSIVKTEDAIYSGGGSTELHNHNDGQGDHAHTLPGV